MRVTKKGLKKTVKTAGGAVAAVALIYAYNNPREAAHKTTDGVEAGGDAVIDIGRSGVTYIDELGNHVFGRPSTRVDDNGVLVISFHGEFPDCQNGTVPNDEEHGWAVGVLPNQLGTSTETVLDLFDEHPDFAKQIGQFAVLEVDC